MGATLIDCDIGNVVLAAAHNRAQVLERSSAEELDVDYITVTFIRIPLYVRKGKIYFSFFL